MRVLHHGLGRFSDMFVKKGDFIPDAGSRTSQQKTHSWSDVPGSGSSWVVVRLQNHDAFFLASVYVTRCYERNVMFRAHRSAFWKAAINKKKTGVLVTHVNLKLSQPKLLQVSDHTRITAAGDIFFWTGLDLSVKKYKEIITKLNSWGSSWWFFSRPAPACTSSHSSLNLPFPRLRQLTGSHWEKNRVGVGVGGEIGCWFDGEKHTGGGVCRPDGGGDISFEKCVCVCKRERMKERENAESECRKKNQSSHLVPKHTGRIKLVCFSFILFFLHKTIILGR